MSKRESKTAASLEKLVDDDENVYAYWAEIVASVILFFAFVGIFYFTIAKNIEGEIVEKNVNIIVDDFTGNITDFVPSAAQTEFKNKLETYLVLDQGTVDNLNQQDANIDASNQQLLQLATKYIIGVFILGSLIIAGLYYGARYQKKPFKLSRVIKHTLIVLVFVAITEYSFLRIVGYNYTTADSNVVKKAVIDGVISFGNS